MIKFTHTSEYVSYQERFHLTAQDHAQEVAVIDDEHSYSYAQLNADSDRLSLHLQTRGAQPDCLIAIFMPPSYEYIVSVIATLKAGSAFLPISIDLPTAQVEAILADSRPLQILTTPDTLEKLNSSEGAGTTRSAGQTLTVTPTLLSHHDQQSAQAFGELNPLVPTNEDALAFATYTSGTTGEPKGVLQVQRALVTSYQSRYEYQPYQPHERVACNIFFMWEILRPLMYGAAVVVIPDRLISVPKKLLTLLETHRVTEVLFTPSAFQRLIRSIDPQRLRAQLSELRTVWLNGEVVSAGLVREGITALPESTSLLNTYSICECHDVSNSNLRALTLSSIESAHEGVCPVGVAVDGVTALVMRDGELSSHGEGELFIGGQGLGRGYLNRDALTQERFPLINGVRYYATGDQASLSDGIITIKGRLHSMVKMRGYSVYLGAIEEALRQHPEIQDARVFLRGDHLSQHLTAFIVGSSKALSHWIDEAHQTSAKLRSWLGIKLPAYMIPNKWVPIEQFPVHRVSGKLDQESLWSLERDDETSLEALARSPQQTPTERRELMRRLWARALEIEVDQITAQTDFFKAGGHSLSVVDLVISIEEVFGLSLEGDELYNAPLFSDFIAITLRDTSEATKSGESPDISLTSQDSHLSSDGRSQEPTGPFWAPEDVSLFFPSEHPWASREAESDRQEAERIRLSEARSILLTGATGYLGLGLLEALLSCAAPSAEIICLVRSGLDQDGVTVSGAHRLSQLYSEASLGSLEGHLERGRLLIVEGDITEPDLGLPRETYTELATRVEVIFHCAALVNLRAQYHQTKPSIVDGSRRLIFFATDQRVKTLHHISTNSVIARPRLHLSQSDQRPLEIGDEPEEREPYGELIPLRGLDTHLTDGYSQAKWVAEVLVEEAIRLGLPATIYRPGNIGPHRATRFSNPRDLHQLIWTACVTTRVVPLNTGWQFELIPVDLMVALILELAELKAPQLRYHLVHPHPLDADQLFNDWLALGRAARGVDGWREWRAELARAEGDLQARQQLRVLASALSSFNKQLTDHPAYSLEHLRRDLPLRADYFDHPPELNEFFKELFT